MKTLFFLLFSIPLFWSQPCNAQGANTSENAVGTVVGFSGKAILKRKSLPDAPLTVNTPVFNSDLIRTGNNSAVKILLKDQSILDIGPSSVFKIDTFDATGSRPSLFILFYGKLRALVTKAPDHQEKMRFRTPTAIMGIRGTELIINAPVTEASSAQTQVTVISGSVSMSLPQPGRLGVSTSGAVLVNAGQQARAFTGAQNISAPVTLTPSQMQTELTQGRMADPTFDQNVTFDSNEQSAQGPKAASAKNIATDQLVEEGAHIKNTTDEVRAENPKMNLTPLRLPLDPPVSILTGLLKSVKVSLLNP